MASERSVFRWVPWGVGALALFGLGGVAAFGLGPQAQAPQPVGAEAQTRAVAAPGNGQAVSSRAFATETQPDRGEPSSGAAAPPRAAATETAVVERPERVIRRRPPLRFESAAAKLRWHETSLVHARQLSARLDGLRDRIEKSDPPASPAALARVRQDSTEARAWVDELQAEVHRLRREERDGSSQ